MYFLDVPGSDPRADQTCIRERRSVVGAPAASSLTPYRVRRVSEVPMLEAKLFWFLLAGALFFSVIVYAASRRKDVGQRRILRRSILSLSDPPGDERRAVGRSRHRRGPRND